MSSERELGALTQQPARSHWRSTRVSANVMMVDADDRMIYLNRSIAEHVPDATPQQLRRELPEFDPEQSWDRCRVPDAVRRATGVSLPAARGSCHAHGPC